MEGRPLNMMHAPVEDDAAAKGATSASTAQPSTPAFSSYFFANPTTNDSQHSKAAEASRSSTHNVDPSIEARSSAVLPSVYPPTALRNNWIADTQLEPSAATTDPTPAPADVAEGQDHTQGMRSNTFVASPTRPWALTSSMQSNVHESSTNHHTSDMEASDEESGHEPQVAVQQSETSFQLQPVPACKRRKLQPGKEVRADMKQFLRESLDPDHRRKSHAGLAMVAAAQAASSQHDERLARDGRKSERRGRERELAGSAIKLAFKSPFESSAAAEPSASLTTVTTPATSLQASTSAVVASIITDNDKVATDKLLLAPRTPSAATPSSSSTADRPPMPPIPPALNRPVLLSIKRNAILPPPAGHAVAHCAPSHGSSRRRAARLRRAHSVPNLRAKATVDLESSAQHRLIFPQQWLNYMSSYGRSSKDGTSSRNAAFRSGKVLPSLSQMAGSAAGSRSRSVFTPSLHPPITRHTLRELDLFEILKNPQLRHDVVFDPNVQFRPNFDGERGRRKREAGERYWTAVVREIETGCTCTGFDQGELLACTCSPRSRTSSPFKGDQHVSLSKTIRPATGRNMVSPNPRVPSRIPLLVQELRAICLSILPSNFPLETGPSSVEASASSSSSSRPMERDGSEKDLDAGSNDSSRATSPTGLASNQLPLPSAGGPSWAATHHALIAQTLDPHLIAQELQHGVLDVPALVTFMGSILKLHCAPMRDEAIEKMVEVVCVDGDIGKGLRLCFEILELMKLDIANHQLRSTRPYLVETAVEFEIRWFQDQIEQRKISLDRTSAWFISSLGRAKDELPNSSRSEVVTRAFNDGMLKLVFDTPSSMPVPPSPAPAPSPSSSSLNHTFSSCYPETFQFDAYRMMTFHNDVADLTIVYMLLLLFRQLACSPLEGATSVPPAAAGIAQRQLKSVKGEIWCLLNDANLCLSGSGAQSPLAAGSGRRSPTAENKLFLGSAGGFAKLEYPRWRRAMQNVLLQIAVRASAVQLAARGPTTDPAQIKTPAPSFKTQALLNSWMDTNLCVGSPLHKLCQGRLRGVVLAMLAEKLNGVGSPSSEKTAPSVRKRASEGSDDEAEDESSSTSQMLNKRVKTESGDSKTAAASTSVADTLRGRPSTPIVATPTSSTDPAVKAAASVTWEATLTRAGLDPFSSEIRLLCDRIAKVATFHLRVFRNLYEKIEAKSLKKSQTHI